MADSNNQSPARKRYLRNAHGLRSTIKRETAGRTRNLSEDFTARDFTRMEARARAAMKRSTTRIEGQ